MNHEYLGEVPAATTGDRYEASDAKVRHEADETAVYVQENVVETNVSLLRSLVAVAEELVKALGR